MSKSVLALLVILLAACQPAPVAEITAQPPVKVALSPSLTWLEGDLAGCAATVEVAVQRADDMPSETGVIELQLGEPPAGSYAAVLGVDHLVVIVHPDNPLTELSVNEAQDIFSGRQKTWADGSEIQTWSLPATMDVSTALTAAGFTFANTGLSPTPKSMLEAVAANPLAIGYLPARWLDSSVRALDVTDLKVDLPVLAVSELEPQGNARALLVCLQEKIGE